MKLKFCFLILNFTILYNFSNALSGQYVRDARQNEFNYVVSIRKIGPSVDQQHIHHECTGTFVTKRDIVTANHCLITQTLNEVLLVAGATDIRLGLIFHPFWWINYNEWATQLQIPLLHQINDVAFIRITETLPNNIGTPHLTNFSSEYFTHKRVNIAGWCYENGQLVLIMRTAGVYILAKEDCDIYLTRVRGASVTTDERVMCSNANPPVLIGPGDNGGPAIFNGELLAVNIGTYTQNNIIVNIHSGIEFYKGFISFMIDNF